MAVRTTKAEITADILAQVRNANGDNLLTGVELADILDSINNLSTANGVVFDTSGFGASDAGSFMAWDNASGEWVNGIIANANWEGDESQWKINNIDDLEELANDIQVRGFNYLSTARISAANGRSTPYTEAEAQAYSSWRNNANGGVPSRGDGTSNTNTANYIIETRVEYALDDPKFRVQMRQDGEANRDPTLTYLGDNNLADDNLRFYYNAAFADTPAGNPRIFIEYNLNSIIRNMDVPWSSVIGGSRTFHNIIVNAAPYTPNQGSWQTWADFAPAYNIGSVTKGGLDVDIAYAPVASRAPNGGGDRIFHQLKILRTRGQDTKDLWISNIYPRFVIAGTFSDIADEYDWKFNFKASIDPDDLEDNDTLTIQFRAMRQNSASITLTFPTTSDDDHNRIKIIKYP